MADDPLGIPYRPGYAGPTATQDTVPPAPETPDLSNKVLPVPTKEDTERRAAEARARAAKETPPPEKTPEVTGPLPGLGGAAEKAVTAPPTSPYAGNTGEGFATVGTTFGGWIDGNDPDDNGRGYWGADTTKWDQHGVALPPAAIRRFYGVSPDDPDFAARVQRGEVLVRVVNPKSGQSTIAPLLDLGPAGWTGAGIDLKPYTAYSIGIKDPRNFKGEVNFYPYVDPNQKDQKESSTGKQTDVQPHDIDWDASARRASGTVFAQYPAQLSPLDKYRQKHPEDKYTDDATLSEKIRTGMGLKEITPEDFQKSVSIKDNGQAFDNFLAEKTSPLQFYKLKHHDVEKLDDDQLIKKLYAEKKEPGETLDDFHLRMKPVDNPWWNVMFQKLGSWMRPISAPIMAAPPGTMGPVAGATPPPPTPRADAPKPNPQTSLTPGPGELIRPPQRTPMTPGPGEMVRASQTQTDLMAGVREVARNLHAATQNLEKTIGLDKVTSYLDSLNPNWDTGWESGLGQIYEYPSDIATLWNSTVGLATANALKIPNNSPFFQYTKELSDAYKKKATEDQANAPKPANFADELVRGLTEGAGATGPEGLKFMFGFAGAEIYGAEKAAMVVAAINGIPGAASGKPIESVIDMTTTFLGARVMSSPIGRWKSGILNSILGMSNQTAKDIVEGRNTDLQDLAKNGAVAGILGALAGQAKSELNEFGVNPAETLHRPAEPPPIPSLQRYYPETIEGRTTLPGPTQPRPQVISPSPGRVIRWIDPDVLKPYIANQPRSPANVLSDIQSPMRDGQPIQAPQISLDANGRINIKDFNRVQALVEYGLDAVPVNVDEATAKALDKRGYVISDNGVSSKVNGEPVLRLTDAQRSLVDKAAEQYSNGQVNEAASTLDELLAGLDPVTRQALMNIAEKKLNGVEVKNPEAKATKNRETVEQLDKPKVANPEEDSSNPNGQWPTSETLNQEAMRLGAMTKKEFLEAVKTTNPDLLNRLAERFGVKQGAATALWQATRKHFELTKPDSKPPDGMSAEEWQNTHPNAKAAIAADLAKQETGIDPKRFWQAYQQQVEGRGLGLVDIATLRDALGVSQKEMESFLLGQEKAGNIELHGATATTLKEDQHVASGVIRVKGREALARLSINKRSPLFSTFQESLQKKGQTFLYPEERPKTEQPRELSMREAVAIEKRPITGPDGKTLKDSAGKYKFKYVVRMTDKGGNVHEHTADTLELAQKLQKVLYSIYKDSKATDGHQYFYANPAAQLGDLSIELTRLAAASVLPHVRRVITDPIGKFLAQKSQDYGLTKVMGLSVSEKSDVAKQIIRQSNAMAQTMMNRILHMQAVRDKLQQIISKGDQSARRQAFWDQFSHAEIRKDLTDFENGIVNSDPTKQAFLESDKGVYDLQNAIDKQFGLKYGYIENYIPHIYRPQDLAKVRANWQKFKAGKPGFTYERSFHDYEQAFMSSLNLRPRYHNPELIKQHRLSASMQMINKKLAYGGMEDIGLAVRRGHPLADQWLAAAGLNEPESWAISPTGEKYVFHPDVHEIVKNRYKLDDFLAHAPGAKLLLAYKGLELKSELALSAFHLLHIATMSVADDITMGDPTKLNVIKSGQMLLNHLLPWDRLYREVTTTDPVTGQKTRSYRENRLGWHGQYPDVINYFHGGDYPTDPVAQRMIRVLQKTGFNAQMSRESQLAFIHIMREGARAVNLQFRGLYKALNLADGAIEGLLGQPWLMSQLFNRYIPIAKARATMALYDQFISKHPNLADPQTLHELEQEKVALKKIGEMVEFRYGEIQFNNLFMQRWLKTAGTMGLLSLSWKMGMFQTYGGALYDLGNSALHLDQILAAKKAGDPDAVVFTTRSKYGWWLALVGGLACGVISGILKKRVPDQFNDFFFPVVGFDNQGRPIRGRTPFWSAELTTLFHEAFFGRGLGPTIMDTLKNWSSPGLSTLNSMAVNRDYYGNPISQHDPFKSIDAWIQPKEWSDRVFYAFSRLWPITIQQGLEAGSMGELTGGIGKVDFNHFNWGQALTTSALSFVGLSRAPKWTMRSPAENRIMDFYGSHLPAYEKRYEDIPLRAAKNELKYAHQYGSKEEEQRALDEMRKAGAKDVQVKNALKNLEYTDAENAMRHMEVRDRVEILKQLQQHTPREVDHYLELVGPTARKEFEAWRDAQQKPQVQTPEATLPSFQEGGVVTQPTVATVGESGPEAVVPMKNLSDDDMDVLHQLLAKAQASPLPEGSVGSLAPASGKTSTHPDFIAPRGLTKSGDVRTDMVFPWWDQSHLAGKALEDAQHPELKGDEIRRFPYADPDYPDYQYGDKLPKNRGVPAPMEPYFDPGTFNM